jgi:RimJ/RimL family protein N-acetyltransferase
MNCPLTAFPISETERLSIRPLAMAEADAVRTLTDDPLITNVVHFLPNPFTRADAEALIGRNDDANCFLGVRLGTDLVGVVGTHKHGDDRLEVGYWIGSAFQRRGVAMEAVTEVIARLRQLYPHRQIVAECRRGNEASWGLLYKLGFVATGQEGHRPGRELLAIPMSD